VNVLTLADIASILFWLIFFFLIFSPTTQQARIRAARARILATLEAKTKMKFITLIHRQERVGIFGIPVYRYIDIDDSEEVLRAIREVPKDVGIALVLHTPGGLVLAASQIALALKRHPGKKVVIIPHYAMSGGTLISLAADEIWMDRNAVLGPVDPQIPFQQYGSLPAPSIVKLAKMKGDKAEDMTLIMADVAEKAIVGVRDIVFYLLKDKMGEEKAKELAEKLTAGLWTHDHPITFEEAKELGLPVKDEVPPEVYELMSLYKAPLMQRSGVEYIPWSPQKSTA
jgi:ClpP class serine protease